jgi:hypothetical protein
VRRHRPHNTDNACVKYIDHGPGVAYCCRCSLSRKVRTHTLVYSTVLNAKQEYRARILEEVVRF